MKKLNFQPKYLVCLVFFLIITAYAVYQTHGIVSGPSLVIFSPTAVTEASSPLLEITGQAKRIARIFLNDTPIFTDEQGNFKEKLLLAPGYTIIKLTVEDRFGRQVERELKVVYETKKPLAVLNSN